jgi:hypothetical protein
MSGKAEKTKKRNGIADVLDLNVATGGSCKVVDNGLEEWMCEKAQYHRNLHSRYQKTADNATTSLWYQRAKRLHEHFQQEDAEAEKERQEALALVEGMRP